MLPIFSSSCSLRSRNFSQFVPSLECCHCLFQLFTNSSCWRRTSTFGRASDWSWSFHVPCPVPTGSLFFFLLHDIIVQIIIHITSDYIDIYKSDYYWDQLTSMLMKHWPDFNPHKYSRDVYSLHLGKEENCIHSNLIEEWNIPTIHLWGFKLKFNLNLPSLKFNRLTWFSNLF